MPSLQHFKIYKTRISCHDSMEDEWVFNNLNFIKSKVHNQLIENLALYVCMFGQ